MNRAYYSSSIAEFCRSSPHEILGILSATSEFTDEQTQKESWKEEIRILKEVLQRHAGSIYFEYSIPRMGRRIDVLIIIRSVIFILEFKVGEKSYPAYALDQVMDYALDLKNFHETSHETLIAPILVATQARDCDLTISMTPHNDKILLPIRTNEKILANSIATILRFFGDDAPIQTEVWERGRYHPTPTIIEAAMALYNNHSVQEITRSDAGAVNLTLTSDAISEIIRRSKEKSEKAICFVTGVPGAGKTLVGLDIATKHIDKENELYSVFLSGNGPLVAVLQEALARDRVHRSCEKGIALKLGEARSEVKAFIQNVHHFRDECLKDEKPPIEHVALFDEAQRAWTSEQTANFMKKKKGIPDFYMSEPEFLISCLHRHPDWAVVVCLVGGGQEINTGEAGISEWIEALERSFPDWKIYISSRLTDSEYNAEEILRKIRHRSNVTYYNALHLAVSMRSFRAENVSLLVKQILDLDVENARQTLKNLKDRYPIAITRDVAKAKKWLKEKARGSERYGIVVSSQAYRLKPLAMDVRYNIDPIHWFLDGKDDVRSSYFLEDVATEFQVQGLELDWACVTWDADFRYSDQGWEYRSFVGDKWQCIKKEERKKYLKNAYRVLLTRARQGMIILVPAGDAEDPTRRPEFYDKTFNYLESIGFEAVS